MTPVAIIALVKDVVIVLAIAAVCYFLVSYGKDIVKVADIKAVQKQLIDNAKVQDTWRKEQSDAEVKRNADIWQLTDAIGRQHTPIFVRSSPSVCPVSSSTSTPSSQSTAKGGTNQGSGTDLRPQINAFEIDYEKHFADCRKVLESWPHPEQ